MKFEQLLQIYWSKGFLHGGRVRSFNSNLTQLFDDLEGFSNFTKIKFIKRFELNDFNQQPDKLFTSLPLDYRKIMNMYFSQQLSINNNLKDLLRYNVLRLYLVKSFRGRAQALGKPSRGQRTWSNAWTAYKYNKIIRFFISEMLKNNKIVKKTESKNRKLLKKKIKKTYGPKLIRKKKTLNLWY